MSKPRTPRATTPPRASEPRIESLGEDEELIDHHTFSDLHARLARARNETTDPVDDDALVDADDELLLEEIASELPTERLRAGEASVLVPPRGPSEVAALEGALQGAPGRNDVAALALRLALVHAQSVGLFVVSRGLVAGLRGAGAELGERIEGIMLPTDAETFLTWPLASHEPYRGGRPGTEQDTRLLRAMGRGDAHELWVAPIAIRGRVVNLLYADNGKDPFGETSAAALRALAQLIAGAYSRLILQRKRAEADS